MKKTKKFLALLLALVMVLALAACGGKTETPEGGDAEPAAFTPSKTGEWVINYNAGSGADIFTRACTTALLDGGICEANLPVVAKPEGSGVVAIQYMIDISNQEQANNTLITLGGGDLTEAAEIAGINKDGIQPICVMAAETPMLVMAKDGKYADFMAAVDAMKNGTQVVFCGPQNDYEKMANEIRDTLGLTEAVFTYIPYTSGKEGLTALIGGHADFALCTPAHGSELVASGDIIPQWVYSAEHYQYGALVDLPTLNEISGGAYPNLEFHVYRVICASAKMEPAAVDYWLDCMQKVAETDSWKEYCANFSMTTMIMSKDEAVPYL